MYNKTRLIFKSDKILFQLEKYVILLIQMLIYNDDFILPIDYINFATEFWINQIIYITKDFSEGIFIDNKKK